MRIVDLPLADRPRERLLDRGAEALADRELLALLLGTGARGVGAHQLGELLLNRFGSLTGLSSAHPAEVAGVPGVGVAKAAALAAAWELGRRAGQPAAGTTLANAADIAAVAAPLLRGRRRERLVLLTCDNSHRVLAREVAAEGAAGEVAAPVREIIVAVLRRDGVAFALAHNHPGGDATPSDADIAATRSVAAAAAAVGLRFLDHVVVTDEGWGVVPLTG
ncbi:RadC family protein [Pilimelia columellifera]|uniref:DNA repair protein RadC n=1 Tax=Pilimelia columellifera subsp. columellifera TaxID=706583 RepID=A0ABN3NR01_9ACTN